MGAISNNADPCMVKHDQTYYQVKGNILRPLDNKSTFKPEIIRSSTDLVVHSVSRLSNLYPERLNLYYRK